MYTDRDFVKMRVKPLTNDDDYSALKQIESIQQYGDDTTHKKKIVNYILLMYDPESPFVKRYQNILRRIDAVSDYVGLNRVKKEIREKITQGEDVKILSMINDYVKWLHIRLWSLIVVSETTFYEYQKELMIRVTGADSKDKLTALEKKTKILEALDKISQRLDGYYSQLYANDRELEKKIEQTTMITPEAISAGEKFEI